MFIDDSLRHVPVLAALGCVLAWPSFATAQAQLAPDPGDATLRVAPLIYKPVFGTYRASSEEPVQAWRESNDTAARIGGWRAYAREAREAPSTPPAASAPASRATPVAAPSASSPVAPRTAPAGEHGGHGGHVRP